MSQQFSLIFALTMDSPKYSSNFFIIYVKLGLFCRVFTHFYHAVRHFFFCSPLLSSRCSPTFRNTCVRFTFSGLPTLNLCFFRTRLWLKNLRCILDGKQHPQLGGIFQTLSSYSLLSLINSFWTFLNILKLLYTENQMYLL